MRTDYHCHVLPGIDDGAKDVEMSLHMLEMLYNQGVEELLRHRISMHIKRSLWHIFLKNAGVLLSI